MATAKRRIDAFARHLHKYNKRRPRTLRNVSFLFSFFCYSLLRAAITESNPVSCWVRHGLIVDPVFTFYYERIAHQINGFDSKARNSGIDIHENRRMAQPQLIKTCLKPGVSTPKPGFRTRQVKLNG